jgi:predicted nucleotidyltransferase component of viral defense system
MEEIRLLSAEDIIPMKLKAVSNRNEKKDYWDITTLLSTYSIDKMMTLFKSKFPQIGIAFIIHSLTDFEKAESVPDPDVYDNKTWDDIKLLLTSAVRKYTLGLL